MPRRPQAEPNHQAGTSSPPGGAPLKRWLDSATSFLFALREAVRPGDLFAPGTVPAAARAARRPAARRTPR